MITPIARIEGTVVEAGPEGVVVMAGGVGFGLQAPLTTVAQLKVGERAALHTHFALREDGASLYGFATAEDRRLFTMLLGVSGIGPKAALSALSAMSPRDLLIAIAAGDVETLRRLPGVGPKTAARMVIDLKGNLEASGLFAAEPAPEDDAILALVALGYAPGDAARAVDGIEGSTEERIRLALRRFAGEE